MQTWDNPVSFWWHDLWHKSYAEQQRDKYYDAMSGADLNLSQIYGLDDLLTAYTTDFDNMEDMSSDLSGYLATKFFDCEEINREDVTTMIADLKQAIADLTAKRDEAERQYEYWKSECERENREHTELEEADYN